MQSRRSQIQGFTLLCTGIAAIMLMAGTALAGPLADGAQKAEDLARADKTLEAYSAIRDAVGDFSATLPFTIGKATFVTEPPVGYGIYTPRTSSEFKASEPLITYIEPIGLTWKPADEAGKQQTRFTVDFDVLDSSGEVLATQKAFGNFAFVGYYRNQELFTHLKLDISSAPAGNYVLRYILNDTNSGRTAKVEQPFTIVAK
jgi:hypothetical protein